MGRWWPTALIVAVAACGPPGDFTGEGTDGVMVSQVAGAWVFHHDSADGMDAQHGGELRVEDGCLLLGDALVVWDATVIVTEQDGEITVDLGGERRRGGTGLQIGGGFGWEVGDAGTAPAAIADRCPRRSVFYMAP